MISKDPPKELKDFLDNFNKEHDSVYKERELDLKGCLIKRFTYRQEPSYLIQISLYGYCYPPYKDVLGNWIVYS